MLHDGLYEQVINKELDQELSGKRMNSSLKGFPV